MASSNFIVRLVSGAGKLVMDMVGGLGSFLMFVGYVFREAAHPPFRSRLIFQQMFFLGIESLFI